MGEILQIQVGRCGNRIGDNFWKIISNEHGLDEEGKFSGYSTDEQLEHINVYYDESQGATKAEFAAPERTPMTVALVQVLIRCIRYHADDKNGVGGVYVPRAVFVDSDSALLNTIGRRQCGGNAYRKQNFVGGHGGTGSNWARGYYGSSEILSLIADTIQSEAERCDRLQGFQLVHSMGGGTGSGLGGRVLDHIRVSYPNQVAHTYSTAPWMTVSDEPTESYNVLLSAARLVGGAHATYLADNRALFDSCCSSGNKGGSAIPAYADLNHLVSQIMSGTTTGLRFSSKLNADMRKCTANLVPYPRLHFFVPGFAPLTFRGQTDTGMYTISELATQLFGAVRQQRRCTGVDTIEAVVMAAVMTFRGRGLETDSSCSIPLQPTTEWISDPERCWLPDNLKTFSYGVPSHGLENSGTVVANTTAVRDVFERYCQRFASMLAKRKLLHKYTEEGLDSDEFRVALEQIESLLAEYLAIEQINCSGDDGGDKQSFTNTSCMVTSSTVDGCKLSVN